MRGGRHHGFFGQEKEQYVMSLPANLTMHYTQAIADNPLFGLSGDLYWFHLNPSALFLNLFTWGMHKTGMEGCELCRGNQTNVGLVSHFQCQVRQQEPPPLQARTDETARAPSSRGQPWGLRASKVTTQGRLQSKPGTYSKQSSFIGCRLSSGK